MIIQYKCPSCGADLQYDSKSKKLKCDSCGREMEVDDAAFDGTIPEGEGGNDAPNPDPLSANSIPDEAEFEEIEIEENQRSFKEGEGRQYNCNNCGAVVITTDDTTATTYTF